MRQGRFEMASGGTLFLDEIGDMPLPLKRNYAQLKPTIQRVGAARMFPLICASFATHQNIEADIDAGKFRADLFTVSMAPN